MAPALKVLPSARKGEISTQEAVMRTSTSVTTLAAAAAAIVMLSGVGQAAPPTQADFDACNGEAQMRGANPAASPGAPGTSGTTPSTDTPRPSPGPSPSGGADPDSQLGGIAAAGQSDPAYQQAYRECLKRRGF